jgi:S1-C subfamily serine protease
MIGINSQILSPAGGSVGVGFAVPVSIAKRVVPQLIRNGEVVRPKLGVRTYNVDSARGQGSLPVSEGAGIFQVIPNSAAAAAGLRGIEQTPDGEIILGDIIVAIDGEKVSDQDDLFRILDKHQIGDIIRVEVVREGGRVSVPVRLIPERRGILRE